jgi:hypothetical protein
MQNDDVNRSLDLSEILARSSRQALLQGGPRSGRLSSIPVLVGQEWPGYVCQPGLSGDVTMYHYVHVGQNVYQYLDHCSTVGFAAHHNDDLVAEVEHWQAGSWSPVLVVLAALVLGSIAVSICLIGVAAVAFL